MIKYPKPADHVVVEDLDDDVCLYRSDTREVLVLNRSAGDVWRLADGSMSTQEIIVTLARAYETSVDALASDVQSVLLDLGDRGYLAEASDA